MSGFPLYDNLIKELPKKDLTVKKKEQFIKDIQKIDQKGMDLLYALVVVFHRENITQDEKIPYEGEREKVQDDIYNYSWTFTKFPIRLRHLLSKFIHMHLKQQLTEVKRM